MTINTVSLLTFFAYGAAILAILLKLFRKLALSQINFFCLVLLATISHGYWLYQLFRASIPSSISTLLKINTTNAMNATNIPLGSSHLFSFICWTGVLIALFISWKNKNERFILLALPITACSILLATFFPTNGTFEANSTHSGFSYIFISVLAFGTLALAAIQAILLLPRPLTQTEPKQTLQDNPDNLSKPLNHSSITPSDSLLKQLFQTLLPGIFFLSASLFSVFLLFDEELMLIHSQKIISTALSFGLFATIFYRRRQTHLRTNRAVYWIIGIIGLILINVLTNRPMTLSPT